MEGVLLNGVGAWRCFVLMSSAGPSSRPNSCERSRLWFLERVRESCCGDPGGDFGCLFKCLALSFVVDVIELRLLHGLGSNGHVSCLSSMQRGGVVCFALFCLLV